ncbi:hypothetical protein F4808DRAFT_445813 [Astrocystis sublimbata]|nr:hypothetical protein F4808DRAFT_445813 [Astrocystis sublimbata]
MAMKIIAILALAGAAFAEMDMSNSIMSLSTVSAVENIVASSAITVTTNCGSASTHVAMPLSFKANGAHNNNTTMLAHKDRVTATVTAAAYTGYPPVAAVTGTGGVFPKLRTNSTLFPKFKTNSTTSAHHGSMGGLGATPKPKVRPTESAHPATGNGVMNGVSIGLFLAFLAMASLLQL